jgi:hypothetical protein
MYGMVPDGEYSTRQDSNLPLEDINAPPCTVSYLQLVSRKAPGDIVAMKPTFNGCRHGVATQVPKVVAVTAEGRVEHPYREQQYSLNSKQVSRMVIQTHKEAQSSIKVISRFIHVQEGAIL